MIRNRLTHAALCLLLLCLPLSGCSDNDRKKSSSPAVAQQPAGGTGTTTTTGTVSQLIGDDDSGVSPQLQSLVAGSVVLGETDEPLDF
jgi:hypothetical protein